MKRKDYKAAIAVALLAATAAAQQTVKLTVSAQAIKTIELTGGDLAKMTRIAIDARDPHSGEPRKYEGVRMSELLAKAGVPLGDALKGKALATYVLARAADGYAVVFSIAELDPAMNENQIMVADKVDGKPLDDKQGPLRVIVPGEKRAARWIRMLTSLEVVSAISPSGSLPRSP